MLATGLAVAVGQLRLAQQPQSGATLIGTILSSDIYLRTNENNRNDWQSNCPPTSHYAFLLLVLLPVPKSITHDKPLRGVLEKLVTKSVS